ncbi:MAG: hypothetical protein ACRBN8_45470 [Nannocystales bacterium]
MSTTNRITSRNAVLTSFGALGLLACFVAVPVNAAPAEGTSASTPEASKTEPRAKKPPADDARRQARQAPGSKPKPRATKTGAGPLDTAARRALRASSSRQRAPLEGERVAMRTIAPAGSDADPPKRGKSKKKRGKKRGGSRASGEGADRAPDASDRKISLDEDFLVEGRLEKPNAFFILRRSQSAYDWARLDAKFLPLVLESVQDPLF